MKKASIISIGNELLSGRTIDTNAACLSSQLLSIGIPTESAYTIADRIDSIVRTLTLAAGDADIVLVTGGLGPTDDDVTRQGFAEFLKSKLQLDKGQLKKIQDFFSARNLQMPEKNKCQAYIPAYAKALDNNLGTAPGIFAEQNGKLFIAMPGVPSEMKDMFENSVFEHLKKLAADQAIVVRKIKCFGAGESTIAEMLGDLMHRDRNPLINCTVHYGVITLHIIAAATDKSDAEQMAQKDEQMLRNIIGQFVYGSDEQSLADVVADQLTQQKKTIALAESCTGGTLAKLLTDIPGASEYFTGGWVSYSNEAKTSELDIPMDMIGKHGAVSSNVAQAMAKNARKKAGADFAIAITGIAGPTGQGPQKPVGLVYISLDSAKGCETKRFIFSGDRESTRLRAAQTALNLLRLKLQI